MMRCVLVGAVESTRLAFEALVRSGVEIAAVITVPAAKTHIHSDYVDVATPAEAAGCDVLRTLDVNSADVLARMRDIAPDVIFVIGWSRLCGLEFRQTARIGVIGYHPTLLPKMRGRAALAWTILLDCRTAGGTLFWIDEGVDTGDIAAQVGFDVPDRIDLPTLYGLQMIALGEMLDTLLPRLIAGEHPARRQDHAAATFLAHRTVESGRIDWSMPADDIDRLVRAVTRPYPGAFTELRGDRLTIWRSEPVDRPEWHAQIGQIFVYDDGSPVVRCGGGTSLRLTDYSISTAEDRAPARIVGQPVLGAMTS